MRLGCEKISFGITGRISKNILRMKVKNNFNILINIESLRL